MLILFAETGTQLRVDITIIYDAIRAAMSLLSLNWRNYFEWITKVALRWSNESWAIFHFLSMLTIPLFSISMRSRVIPHVIMQDIYALDCSSAFPSSTPHSVLFRIKLISEIKASSFSEQHHDFIDDNRFIAVNITLSLWPSIKTSLECDVLGCISNIGAPQIQQ